MKRTIILVLLIVFAFSSCYNPSKISFTNISSSYENQIKSFDLKFCAYIASGNKVNLYYKFSTAPLLFIKHKTRNYFFAKYQITYQIYDALQPKLMVDSSTFNFTDSTDFNSPSEISDSFSVALIKPANYIVSYSLTDLNKNYSLTGFSYIDKTNDFTRNNFMIRNEKNQPLIDNYVDKDEFFKIIVNHNELTKLYVSYYKEDSQVAQPPFINITKNEDIPKKDSSFSIALRNGSTDNLALSKTGMYFIRTDTNQNYGFTLFRFYNNFPLMNSPVQMLKPLQYITTKREFDEMNASQSIKSAIDNFWLEKSGNDERAKEMIKVFYNRVQNANSFFSSYKEGWKTDRGMIYIVMGPPFRVYRSSENETWYYGEDRNMLSVMMVFNKSANPFTDNEYLLDRSIETKEMWYNAIEDWRK